MNRQSDPIQAGGSSGGPRTPHVVLAVDTSTAAMAACLLKDGVPAAEIHALAERNHSVHVVPHLQALLADTGTPAEAVDVLVAGTGPGSYTGMRIAVSAVKTLAWAWDKPLVGVSSLEALAYGAWREAGSAAAGGAETAGPSSVQPVASSAQPAADGGPNAAAADAFGEAAAPGPVWYAPLMDARRGQVYTALFAAGPDGGWRRLAPDGIRLMAEWADELARLAEAASPAEWPALLRLCGDPSLHEAEAERLRAALEDGGADSGRAVRVRTAPSVMQGRYVAELGARRLAAEGPDDTHTLVPNYTQLAEAEVKLRAKTGEGSQ